MASIKDTTDATYEADVLKSDVPVLVDYWAPWCNPCKAIAPILEEIQAEYGDRLQIVKVDIDENPKTAAAVGITGIPTLNLYKGGEVVANLVGAQPKPRLVKAIDEHL